MSIEPVALFFGVIMPLLGALYILFSAGLNDDSI